MGKGAVDARMTVVCAALAWGMLYFYTVRWRPPWAIVRRSCQQVSRPRANEQPAVGRRPRASDLAALPWDARGVRAASDFARLFWRRAGHHRSPFSGRRFSRHTNPLAVHAVTRFRSMLSIIGAHGASATIRRFKGAHRGPCVRLGAREFGQGCLGAAQRRTTAAAGARISAQSY